MKTLLILSLSLISLNAFSEVGEEKKSECAFANQSKREPKSVIEDKEDVAKEVKENAAKTISK
jgi:hypothetical protein